MPVKEEMSQNDLLSKVKSRMGRLRKIVELPNNIRTKVKQKKSYAQFGEDIIISDLFSDLAIQNISYLDIGANNPEYIINIRIQFDRWPAFGVDRTRQMTVRIINFLYLPGDDGRKQTISHRIQMSKQNFFPIH